MCKALFVSLALVLCSTACADKAITAAGVTVKVKGQSGKMTLTVPTANASTMDVECQMIALRQLDASGNTLGGGGSTKHSFNSFATQSFTFSAPTTGKYEDLDVSKITFESTLVGSSKVKIETMIFLEDGTFRVGNETVSVKTGAVKFNVVLSSWSWCGGGVSCKSSSGTGASVELDLSIESLSKGSPKTTSKGGAFDLGGGNELLMLNTYSTDDGNSWTEMPTDYPKVDGSKFTLKFPRWADSATVVYDPVVTSAEESNTLVDTAQALGFHLVLAVAILGTAVM